MMRLALVDDHKMFREALRELIEAESPFHVVGETREGSAMPLAAAAAKEDGA